jgi:hypothetical protein
MPTARKNGCLAVVDSSLYYSGGYLSGLPTYLHIDTALEVLTGTAVTPTATASPVGAIAYTGAWCGDANLIAGTDTTNTETSITWDACSARCTANAACNFFVWGAVTLNGVYPVNRCALFTSCTPATYIDGDPNAYSKPSAAPTSTPTPAPRSPPTPAPSSTPTPIPSSAPTLSLSSTPTAAPTSTPRLRRAPRPPLPGPQRTHVACASSAYATLTRTTWMSRL